ncbi:unnamed protein product [Ceutorhynchus assimilis]|uniref:Uncharacterized protein n=1 Tax=Ceutorhynchus assimilis TaxID=467358 RepID=A0A9N9QIA2_9CUCU|nr:unnamed protein product [Ceutorhynchus assimilis]
MDTAIKICYIATLLVAVVMGETQCPEGPKTPQLSTTFLNGRWYEHLYINKALNDETCSYYEISCKNDSLYCDLNHVAWQSRQPYMLIQIWNGTIAENDTGIVLSINRPQSSTVYKDVSLRFGDDAVLMWNCNADADNGLEFASVLKHIKDNAEMESVWEADAKERNYLSLIDDFPAGIWYKINASECTYNKAAAFAHFHQNILVITLFYFSRL